MKKYVAAITALIIALTLYNAFFPDLRDRFSVYSDAESGMRYICMAKERAFFFYKNGRWKKEFVKGVNIGSAKPGAFPGELAITKEEYLRWFKYIRDMNANAIRVYTLQNPEFYEALWEFNKSSVKPLYLFHGVWVDENAVENTMNAFSSEVTEDFKQNIVEVIDAIHGNAKISERKGKGWGEYKKDISQYVAGWILGIEWDPNLVKSTNEKNQGLAQFDGAYLYTASASPFETWLAMMGDYAISYETRKYNMQRPLSFTNWPTTDTLKHPNEPYENEDMVSVNVEKIKAKPAFIPGLFASYHIYPYYPDFMFYQREYASFKSSGKKANTYRAYLRDLIKEHAMPVLVAEFGVPTSRGITHENPLTGFNQGHIDENAQGQMIVSMINDIHDEGYAGGLVFTWQDEWFKRTWNTMDLDIPDRRPFWSNVQTSEQKFGILSFDPGNGGRKVYVDGDDSDWGTQGPLLRNEHGELYAASDEEGVYFFLRLRKPYRDGEKIIIPVDTVPDQGNEVFSDMGVRLGRPCEFVIVIDGKDNSRILVDAYYNVFYHIYGEKLKMLEDDAEYKIKGSGAFRPVYLCLSRKIYLPEDGKTVPLKKYETGRLKYGNANPSSKDYDSLADFSYRGDVVEIRIPWQLLNIMDPSTRMAMDDLHKEGIKPLKIDGIYVSFLSISDAIKQAPEYAFFTWKEWEAPGYHERLKKSYYIVKNGFKYL
ncbi:MAG: hypothetical protein NUV45_09130 [Tepidanaerobacteraceae bacterium]|jgi:hypothetical protein|nr:hypothetical protein [Tepidanaerobacteraceae bacterium]